MAWFRIWQRSTYPVVVLGIIVGGIWGHLQRLGARSKIVSFDRLLKAYGDVCILRYQNCGDIGYTYERKKLYLHRFLCYYLDAFGKFSLSRTWILFSTSLFILPAMFASALGWQTRLIILLIFVEWMVYSSVFQGGGYPCLSLRLGNPLSV